MKRQKTFFEAFVDVEFCENNPQFQIVKIEVGYAVSLIGETQKNYREIKTMVTQI